ncbi:MAG: Rrf2 family transcriptional regulator [Fibromonadales bacterium]|nr:Rrf2 family transcriptional regulator [Fibromonadales bacterium]
MKVSTRGRYALRTLLDLAEHKNNGFISLKEIAHRQNISKLYLEQLVSLLSASNILRANRGKQGGYMLAKEPSQCTVGQILRLTEGNLMPVSCLDDEVNQCERAEFCKTLSLWTGLGKVINDYLDNVTLQDILDQKQSGDNYVI